MPVNNAIAQFTLDGLAETAARYRIPVEDALLIAVNLCGVSSDQNRHRARIAVRLLSAPDTPWTVIVPLNAHTSPFRLIARDLYLGEDLVANVIRTDADEPVGGYFRNQGRAATLNPNARSRCVGCAFCPNTLEAAADPRLHKERDLDELISALVEQHPRRDLTELQEVTISTGCFGHENTAVDHVIRMRKVLTQHKINARIGLLTSVVQADAAFATLADVVRPFVLRLTVECFTRRDLLLKATKARLRTSEMADVLQRARQKGLDTSFTYIVGLDPLEDLCRGVVSLLEYVTEFPNFQVYQAHNPIMAGLRAPGADRLEFYLEARAEIERLMGTNGMRPMAWECYRPLWYFTFAGDRLVDA